MESPVQLKIVEFALFKLPDNGHDSITAIISDLLVSDIPLSKAIELSHPGSVALLNLVWMRSLRDMEHSRWTVAKLLQSEEDYYKWEFSLTLVRAIRRADVKMVQWILTHFSNCLVEKEVVEEAAKGGHLWVLQLLANDHSHGGIEWSTKCMSKAAKGGHWDVVRWLNQRPGVSNSNDGRYSDKVANYAFYQCNLEQLKWSLTNGFELSMFLSVGKCDSSNREKCWELVRYVLSEGRTDAPMLQNRAAQKAAEVGDLDFIKWLIANYVSGRYDLADKLEEPFAAALETAGRFGHVAILEYLLTHLRICPSKAMFQAAKYGRLKVVKWLVNRFARDTTVDLFMGLSYRENATTYMKPKTVMDAAASHGHLEILQFLHQVDTFQRHKRKRENRDTYPTEDKYRRCTDKAMDLAAANGHLKVVKWLHENRNEGCTTYAMSSAAENGHLEVVKWLHVNRSEGCWPNVLDGVVSRYYRRSPCCGSRMLPRKFYEPNLLVQNQLPIVQWLHSNGYEGCTVKAMDGAAANGNFELIKWLHLNTTIGCTYRAMSSAAGRGRLDILQWLDEQLVEGFAYTAMECAAAGGHFDILKWLYEKHLKPCTRRALDVAVHGNLEVITRMPNAYSMSKVVAEAGHGNLEMVKWILAHGENLNIKSAMERAIVYKEPEIVFFLDRHRIDHEESFTKMRARLRYKTPFSIS